MQEIFELLKIVAACAFIAALVHYWWTEGVPSRRRPR